jgi:hypothetical protein
MKSYLCVLPAAALNVFVSTNVSAETFTAETGPNNFTVYNTSDKPRFCQVVVKFTFLREGKRENGETLCTKKLIPAGERVEVCAFSHPKMIEPILRGPLEVTCDK